MILLFLSLPAQLDAAEVEVEGETEIILALVVVPVLVFEVVAAVNEIVVDSLFVIKIEVKVVFTLIDTVLESDGIV